MPLRLIISVFLAGFAIMMLEIVGARILAPYIGTSFFVWTSLIGIILACLSLGNHLGGRLSDKNSDIATLSRFFLFSALSIFAINVSKEIFLEIFTRLIPNIKISSIILSIILFGLPTIILGMITPYSMRLALTQITDSGKKIGSLSAIATLGSILGTFTTGFILLPLIGSSKILFLIAAILLGNSIFLMKRRPQPKETALLLIILLSIGLYQTDSKPNLIADIDSSYNRIQVYDSTSYLPGQTTRLLMVGREAESAQFLESDELVFEYTKWYALSDHFVAQPKSALLIGGGAFSVAQDFLKRHPLAIIDVVEIDPAMTSIAQKFFRLKLPDPRLRIFHEDGRTFLNKNKKQYDVIYIDAFNSFYALPFQLTTQEAAKLLKNSLKPNGVLITNVINSLEGPKSKFLQAEFRTYKSVFPQVAIFPLESSAKNYGQEVQNIMLLATSEKNSPLKNAFSEQNPVLKKYLGSSWKSPIPGELPLLTDDYAPVDNYILELL